MSPTPPSKSKTRSLRIGKYQVISHIASGGMGAVYKAWDFERNQEVALKILAPELVAKPNIIERFRREARSAGKLQYKHIVNIFECGEVGGTHYLAMEFVDGMDLGNYIREKGRLHPKLAWILMRQAGKALAHAFEQGIVHRDIKPSNFLLAKKDKRPLLKLTDLGLAREVNEDLFRLTTEGTTVGTVDYMAPEQARDSASADTRSDMYSLGCTFFHLLTGRPPFEGSLTERILKHLEAKPPNICELNSNVPVELKLILEKMLEKKPEDRYQTPHDLVEDLNHPPPELEGDSGRNLLFGKENALPNSQIRPEEETMIQGLSHHPHSDSKSKTPASVPLDTALKKEPSGEISKQKPKSPGQTQKPISHEGIPKPKREPSGPIPPSKEGASGQIADPRVKRSSGEISNPTAKRTPPGTKSQSTSPDLKSQSSPKETGIRPPRNPGQQRNSPPDNLVDSPKPKRPPSHTNISSKPPLEPKIQEVAEEDLIEEQSSWWLWVGFGAALVGVFFGILALMKYLGN